MGEEINNDIKTNRRTALLAGIALILLLAAGWMYQIYEKKHRENTNTIVNNSSTPTASDNQTTNSNSTSSPAVDSLNQQIQSNPTDPNLYAEKSDALYNSGDTAGALSAVQDGLVTNPDSELLKSKKDVLEKDYFQSSSTDTPRQ